MAFWNNISRSTLRDIARAAGVRTTAALAVEDLKHLYGNTPGDEFIDEMWLVLRDGWLARSAPDRDAVVKGMLAKGRGNTEALRLSTRAGQLQYLKTLRRGPGLTEVVLPIFLASGDAVRPEPVYSEPPASAQEQKEQFEEGVRAGFAGVSAANITSLEIAVLTALHEGLNKLSRPVAEPSKEATRLLSDVLGTFTFSAPEASQDSLLDYQRVLVERIPQRFQTSELIDTTLVTLRVALEAAVSDTDYNPSSLIAISATVWAVLAYGDRQKTPDDFVRNLIEGQRRFITSDDDDSSTKSDLDDVLIELLATIPNVTAPTLGDDGSLSWSMYLGSAVVVIILQPGGNDTPAKITFYSPLVNGITPSGDLADVLNQANAKESLIKFYWSDEAVVLEQEVLVADFSDGLFRYMLSRFASAADYLQDQRAHAAPLGSVHLAKNSRSSPGLRG